MQVTWLTQAGLLIETERVSIMVDPYFSDSVGETLDPDKHRRVPADLSYLDHAPDVLLITHDHLDHLDPATLDRLLDTDKVVTVLSSDRAFRVLSERGDKHNYHTMEPHSVVSVGGVTFYAVKAAHSEPTAIGFVIDDGRQTVYVSGDTLYNFDVIDDVLDLVDDGVDYAFLPINGVGNNMNAKDAADFACEIGAKHAVPLHYGLFDDIDPVEFDFEDAVILRPFEPFEL